MADEDPIPNSPFQKFWGGGLPTPTPKPTPTPGPTLLQRAEAHYDRAMAGIKSLVGSASSPTPAPVNNVLAPRISPIPARPVIPPITPTSPNVLPPIKPGAISNSYLGLRPNPTPMPPQTADTKPSILDARFLNKGGGENNG